MNPLADKPLYPRCSSNEFVIPNGSTIDKKLMQTQHASKVVGQCARQYLCHNCECPKVVKKVRQCVEGTGKGKFSEPALPVVRPRDEREALT